MSFIMQHMQKTWSIVIKEYRNQTHYTWRSVLSRLVDITSLCFFYIKSEWTDLEQKDQMSLNGGVRSIDLKKDRRLKDNNSEVTEKRR